VADQVFVDDEGFLRVFGTNDDCYHALRTSIGLSACISEELWIMGVLPETRSLLFGCLGTHGTFGHSWGWRLGKSWRVA
jgi:hypothetical protein